MMYLCLMPFRRKSSGGWLVSCSLTVHWLHRPGRLLEARVMKADIVSCLGAKAHGFCTSAPPRCGAEGHSVSPEQRFWFWSVAPPSRPVACPSFRWPQFMASSIAPPSRSVAYPSSRWPHFTASSIGSPSRLQSLSFIPMAAFHGLVHRSSIPLPEPVLYPDGRNSWPCPASRLLPCAVFLLFPHPFIPNDAVRCIGHRSALHWALQCAAQAVAVRCVFRCTFMHGRGHAAKLSFPEDRKQKCCAMGYTAQHCLPYTFVLSAQPA